MKTKLRVIDSLFNLCGGPGIQHPGNFGLTEDKQIGRPEAAAPRNNYANRLRVQMFAQDAQHAAQRLGRAPQQLIAHGKRAQKPGPIFSLCSRPMGTLACRKPPSA